MSAAEVNEPIQIRIKLSVYNGKYASSPRKLRVGILDRALFDRLLAEGKQWFLYGGPRDEVWHMAVNGSPRLDTPKANIKARPHAKGNTSYELDFHGLTPERHGIKRANGTATFSAWLSADYKQLTFENPSRLPHTRLVNRARKEPLSQPETTFRPFEPVRFYPKPEDVLPRPVFSTHRGYNLVEPEAAPPSQPTLFAPGTVVSAKVDVVNADGTGIDTIVLDVSGCLRLSHGDRTRWEFWEKR